MYIHPSVFTRFKFQFVRIFFLSQKLGNDNRKSFTAACFCAHSYYCFFYLFLSLYMRLLYSWFLFTFMLVFLNFLVSDFCIPHFVKCVRIPNFSGPYLVRMRKNTAQKSSEYISHSARCRRISNHYGSIINIIIDCLFRTSAKVYFSVF